MERPSGNPASNGGDLDRRGWMKAVAVASAAIAAPVAAVPVGGARAKAIEAGAAAAARSGSATLSAGARVAVAQTHAGRIAGYVHNDIVVFKGVPYGADTGGANRFLPPQPVKPWNGIRSARSFGPICPQDKGTGRLNDEEAFIFQWNDSVEGEDCLRLNIWTPALGSGKKRPVLVWLHGGGFAAGSGHDLPAFDGLNLASQHDAVVVTLNHRLNLLGFMDLSRFGASYAQSGNVGMLDIVAALAWIRDNIAEFGGDTGCVLVFGQSGGGAKVSMLMGMPAARGLFHRAVVMSGSFAGGTTPEKSARLTDLMLAELGVAPGNVGQLQTLPYAQLRRASEAVLARINPRPGPFLDVRRIADGLNFSPVIDGQTILPAAERADMPDVSVDVPMMIGTTLNEFVSGINHPDFDTLSEADLQARVEAFEPGRAAAVIAAFRHRTPAAKPCDLWSRIATAPIRQSAVDQARSKAVHSRAPAYLYWFTWQTPVLDARPRAFHCLDIPFMLANTDRCATMTGGGERAMALSETMAAALLAFARTGSPNGAHLPTWRPVTRTEAHTMIFDDHPVCSAEIDRLERAALA